VYFMVSLFSLRELVLDWNFVGPRRLSRGHLRD
jgi:hypothetical protein